MPVLVPDVLGAMLGVLESDRSAEAVLLGRAGPATGTTPVEPPRRQVLPLALRVQPAARAAREAVEAGRHSLQALVDRLTEVELPPSTWLQLDPDGNSLLDVDTPADLERIRARLAQRDPSEAG